VTLTAICATSQLIVLVPRIRRPRARHEMERYGITPEALHTLFASNQDVLLFDVRLPLDLLASSEIIPGERGLPQEKCLRIRRSSRKTKIRSFIARAQVTKPVAPSCIEFSPWVFYGLDSSEAAWRHGKQTASRSSGTKSPSISTRARSPPRNRAQHAPLTRFPEQWYYF
jgi:hypothetical protein